MREEYTEVVRGAIDAWNRGDYDTWIESFAPDCEFSPLRAQLEDQAYRGHDGLRRFIHDLTEDWVEVRFEAGEMRDVGDQVVVLSRFHGRGRASGAEVDVPIGIVGEVRQGKIAQCRMFSDPEEAFKAAGLD